MKTLIILGSARGDGHTKEVADRLAQLSGWDMIDLLDYNIGHYDYSHANKDDDFLKLMLRIVQDYEGIVIATPVYWYAMSAVMKVFFDRLTDLLQTEKDLGRALRGKHMAVITSSGGDNLGEDFWLPFKHTAAYLGMHYQKGLHTTPKTLADGLFQRFVKSMS